MRDVKTTLNGTWLTVYQEFEGRKVPAIEFEGQKLILHESTYTIVAAKIDEGIINAKGKHLDIYGTDGANKGRHYSAIFQIEKDRLTICYNLTGNGYPTDFETEGNPQHFLSIFERL
jgi:uncharacterized protein (TIGR03067 family)